MGSAGKRWDADIFYPGDADPPAAAAGAVKVSPPLGGGVLLRVPRALRWAGRGRGRPTVASHSGELFNTE